MPHTLSIQRVLAVVQALGIWLLAICCCFVAAAPVSAQTAVPPDAAPLLRAPLTTLSDEPKTLQDLLTAAQKPVLVVLYQDRKSAEQNPQLKEELGRLPTTPRLTIVAIAEVAGYHFWPAKGYVLRALRPLQSDGATVLADWHGSLRKAYRLQSGQSALFVVAPEGQLAYFTQGQLSPGQTEQVMRLVRRLAFPQAP
jgi:hypothetical protein